MVKLYVEGGGDAAALRTACRQGFTTFLTKAGMTRRPRIVACGSRRDAYDSFRIAIRNGEDAMLLVDSESPVKEQHQTGPVDSWQPWQHLKDRPGDGWEKPGDNANTGCHLMVQVMETWFLLDRDALKRFFGQGFRENALPAPTTPVEGIAKEQVYDALGQATRDCKTKARYGKGEHSFELLAKIDPSTVTAASPWARRFIDSLGKKMKS